MTTSKKTRSSLASEIADLRNEADQLAETLKTLKATGKPSPDRRKTRQAVLDVRQRLSDARDELGALK